MTEINAYLIPGMGADHRLYQRFDLGHWKVHHLDWVNHEDSKTLADYARVMARRITTENNVIIGSSMGGMMAVELSHIVKPMLTVLVSAPTGRHEFPPMLNVVRAIRVQKLFGPKTTYKMASLADTFMGFTTKEHRDLFYAMLSENGPDFLHLSVDAVLNWQNTQGPHGRFIQIIGEKDRLFKQKRMQAPIMIPDAGHFAAFEKGEEVSRIIVSYFEKQ